MQWISFPYGKVCIAVYISVYSKCNACGMVCALRCVYRFAVELHTVGCGKILVYFNPCISYLRSEVYTEATNHLGGGGGHLHRYEVQ